jgi:hypothetical protein
MHAPHVASGGRYPVLRTLAIMYLFAAAVLLVLGVWRAISVLTSDAPMIDTVFGAATNSGSRALVAVSWLASSFIGVLAMLGIAELIKLFVDIERNTRAAAMTHLAPAMAPAATETVVVAGADAVAVTTPAPGAPAVAVAGADSKGGRMGQWLEGEETAEGALLRGH